MAKVIEPFDIFVRGDTNKSYVIYVWSATTVNDIKVFFHIKSGEALENMRLVYHSKQLQDNQTVKEVGIKKEEHIFATNRLVGGLASAIVNNTNIRLMPIGYTGSNESTDEFGF
jgi:hypothetical protein